MSGGEESARKRSDREESGGEESFVTGQFSTLRDLMRGVACEYPHAPDELAKLLAVQYQRMLLLDDSEFNCWILTRGCLNVLGLCGGEDLCPNEWGPVRALFESTSKDAEAEFAEKFKNSEVYGIFVYNILLMERNEQEKPRIAFHEWCDFLQENHDRSPPSTPSEDELHAAPDADGAGKHKRPCVRK